MTEEEYEQPESVNECEPEEDQFARFDALTRGLLRVSKDELDEKLEEWRSA